MAYASAIVRLTEAPAPAVAAGKEVLSAPAVIAGDAPVNLTLRAFAGSAAAKTLEGQPAEGHLIASGNIQLDEDGNLPIIEALTICPATDEQYLNEVVIVGRVGSEPKPADSGKSVRRSVAANRYSRPKTEDEKPVEHTDWYGVRAYGFNKDKLEKIEIGSLVEITGSLAGMTNAKGEPYCEVKARTVKTHKSKGSGSYNPAAGTKAAGYAHEDFMGSADDIDGNWD